MTTQFNFRFETPSFFNQELNNQFASLDDLKSYFISFKSHYDSISAPMDKLSKKRMNGKEVEDYSTQHSYFQKLNDHYRILLTIGRNGFDFWLNDLIKN